MGQIRVLSEQDTIKLLDIKQTVAYVEKAYGLKYSGQARLFSMISEDIIEGKAEMDIKSGMLSEEDVFGLKLVSWFGDNTKHGLPSITGMTMIFDLTYGLPKGILNASYMTGMRTGAAGAIGIKYLGRPDTKVLMVVGTGRQAVFQIAASISVNASIKTVLIYDPLTFENAQRFQSNIAAELEKIQNDLLDVGNVEWKNRIAEVEFAAVEDPKEGTQKSDAIITITPSRKALLEKEWIKPGTHLSCMGADVFGKQEIDSKIFENAIVFVDDIQQAITVGETQTAVREGLLSEDSLLEIGKLVNEKKSGRLSDESITIFDGTGIALQDIAVSNYLINKAETLNIGTLINL